MKRDYYEVLGVQKTATLDEIKKAYRKLAMANHPDRNPGDKAAEERFKEATEAYEVLSDDDKRKRYDQFGFDGVNQNGGYQNAYRDFSDIFQGFGGFEDIFSNIFGGGSRSGGKPRSKNGASLQTRVEIDLLEAVKGTNVDIPYAHDVKCKACGGAGTQHPEKKHTCPTCKGTGFIYSRQGFFQTQRTCSACRGEGVINDDPCKDCGGTGVVHKKETIRMEVPAGVEDGSSNVVRGMGNAGRNGGRDGDLYVEISVKDDPRWTRNKNNLYCKLPISPSQAALGSIVQFSLIDGEVLSLEIPKGSENGSYLKVKGKGIRSGKSGIFAKDGDLYVELFITTPKRLSKTAEDLYTKLMFEMGDPCRVEVMKK